MPTMAESVTRQTRTGFYVRTRPSSRHDVGGIERASADRASLDNMKVTVILCVWQYPTTDRNDSAAATSCADVCADSDNHMKMAMMDQTTTIDNDLQYQYCSSNYSAFTKNYQACSNCLETVPQAQTMINYLRILNDACAQQPAAGTGKQISLDFPLFPNGTSAAPSSAVASATGDASTKTSVGATSTSGATPSDQSSAVARSSNSLAAKVGVGVGIGLGLPLLAALAGLLFLLGRRRADRRKEQEESMRRLAWEEGYKAKVMAEAEELHGGTKILPEMMTTALVEADAGPPAVPEKDSYLVTSPNISSPTRSSGSPYGHDNVEVDRDPPIQEQSDDILRSNTPRSVHNR